MFWKVFCVDSYLGDCEGVIYMARRNGDRTLPRCSHHIDSIDRLPEKKERKPVRSNWCPADYVKPIEGQLLTFVTGS